MRTSAPVESLGTGRRRFRLASPRTALVLGGLLVVLLGVWLLLTILTRDLVISNNGSMLANVLTFGFVGVVVALRQPRNPMGWILLGVSLLILGELDAKLYSVLDYRMHRGSLPLGRMAVFFVGSTSLLPILFGMLAVLLFPDGRLSSKRWRRVLWAYIAITGIFMLGQLAGEATVIGRHVQVDVRGKSHTSDQIGYFGVVWVLTPLILVFWASFVGRQIAEWRRSSGERREQLKWLMCGAAICVVATVTLVVTSTGSGVEVFVAAGATLVIASLPVSIGVGILKYRLYEIDRIISRTLVYGALTVVLGASYVGLVLAGQWVSSSFAGGSNLAVAVSTLVVAALFLPARGRIQKFVDRRFYRSRYDAQRTLEAFGARLREHVDLETLSSELRGVVGETMQPESVSLWLRKAGERPRNGPVTVTP